MTFPFQFRRSPGSGEECLRIPASDRGGRRRRWPRCRTRPAMSSRFVGGGGELRFVNRAGRVALGCATRRRDGRGGGSSICGRTIAHACRSSWRTPPPAPPRGRAALHPPAVAAARAALVSRLCRYADGSPRARARRVVARPPAAPDACRPAGLDATSVTRLAEMFAGIVGHDLRNPLNAILTSAHVALQQTPRARRRRRPCSASCPAVIACSG